MRPFRHTLDDGLDIRQAATECMYILLDSCMDRLDMFEFLNHVEDGLKDHHAIKMLTYLMLVRLAHLCPSAVLQRLDRLVEPLRASCTTQVKANSAKQEFEKQDELKRLTMTAVVLLLTVPDADKHPQMNEFVTQIRNHMSLLPCLKVFRRMHQPYHLTPL